MNASNYELILFKPSINPEVDYGVSFEEFFNNMNEFDDPVLDRDYTIRNERNKRETTIELDANVIIKMGEALRDKSKLEEYQLDKFIETIEVLPFITLSPSHTIDETGKYKKENNKYFNKFIDKYLPGFRNQKVNISYSKNKPCPRKISKNKQKLNKPKEKEVELSRFWKCSKRHKFFLTLPYLSLLHLAIVAKKYENESPITKIKHYLNKIDTIVDHVSTKETIIAQHCFADNSYSADPEDFKEYVSFQHDIKENSLFYKKITNDIVKFRLPSSSSAIKNKVFNAANDLALFNRAMMMDSSSEVPASLWIYTLDRKLGSMSKLYSAVSDDRSCILTSLRHTRNDPFWIESNNLIDMCLSRRNVFETRANPFDNEEAPDKEFARMRDEIKKAEIEINLYYG